MKALSDLIFLINPNDALNYASAKSANMPMTRISSAFLE
jgi:hypothetical protein